MVDYYSPSAWGTPSALLLRAGITKPSATQLADAESAVEVAKAHLVEHFEGAVKPIPDPIVTEAHLRVARVEMEKAKSVAGNPGPVTSDYGNGVGVPTTYYSQDVLKPVRAFLSPWVPDIGFGAADDGRAHAWEVVE